MIKIRPIRRGDPCGCPDVWPPLQNGYPIPNQSVRICGVSNPNDPFRKGDAFHGENCDQWINHGPRMHRPNRGDIVGV